MARLLLPGEKPPGNAGRIVFWSLVAVAVIVWLTMSVDIHFRTTEAEASYPRISQNLSERKARALESLADSMKKIERKLK